MFPRVTSEPSLQGFAIIAIRSLPNDRYPRRFSAQNRNDKEVLLPTKSLSIRVGGRTGKLPETTSGGGKFNPALSPVTFHQHPATIAPYPMMSHPGAMSVRRAFPAARFPRIGSTIPAMITGNPDVTAARSRHSSFYQRARWPYTHHYVRSESYHLK